MAKASTAIPQQSQSTAMVPPVGTWRYWLRKNIFYAGLPLVLLADWLIINAVFHVTYGMRFWWGMLAPVAVAPPWLPYLYATGFLATVWVLVFAGLGLYKYRRAASKFDDAVLLAVGLFFGTLIALAMGFFYRDFSYSRLVMVYAVGFSYVTLVLFHLLLRSFQQTLQASGWGALNSLIIGCNSLGEMMASRIQGAPHLGYRLAGFVPGPGEWGEGDQWICPVNTDELRTSSMKTYGQVLGELDELPSVLKRHDIDQVILARPGARMAEFFDLMNRCVPADLNRPRNIQFRIVPDLVEMATAKFHITELDGIPTLQIAEVPLRKRHNRILKRTMDIVLSLFGLLAASPLMLAAAIAVKVTSPGPIFYRQERMGRDGRLFNIYKFRSMVVDAEVKSGPVWATAHDPRTTRVGALLRRLSIDELPQIWNVLKGDMSLVGPRPERPHFVQQFSQNIPKYMDRHLVRSGLTGWAQVNGLRGEEGTIEERTRYDIYYIENWSLLFDLRIIIKTALEVLTHNAY
jgi:exopolysaccharide biosynthesis polyprenyl glycosylphosphotransferase